MSHDSPIGAALRHALSLIKSGIEYVGGGVNEIREQNRLILGWMNRHEKCHDELEKDLRQRDQTTLEQRRACRAAFAELGTAPRLVDRD